MITERAVNRLASAYRTGAAHPLAYLEHAQEYFLKWMDGEDLFTEEYGTAFKGGTAMPLPSPWRTRPAPNQKSESWWVPNAMTPRPTVITTVPQTAVRRAPARPAR